MESPFKRFGKWATSVDSGYQTLAAIAIVAGNWIIFASESIWWRCLGLTFSMVGWYLQCLRRFWNEDSDPYNLKKDFIKLLFCGVTTLAVSSSLFAPGSTFALPGILISLGMCFVAYDRFKLLQLRLMEESKKPPVVIQAQKVPLP